MFAFKNYLLYTNRTTPCHIPESPILANDTLVKFDYDRKFPAWQHVAILGSAETLSHFQSMYYLWLSLPPVMISLGLVLFIAGIFILRYLLRASKNVKLKRAIH
jgi:hypothetical protein